jgi:outer membrane protein assembly factor BamB
MRTTAITVTALLAALGTPAAADELIVTTESGLVQTIDLDSGEIGHRGVCTGSVRSLAVADGVLYLGGFFGDVYVFDMTANQVVDSFTIPSDNNAMAWLGDRLVVGSAGGEVLYVDPADGSVIDTVSQVGTDVTAIGVDAGGLFVGGHSSLAMRTHLGQTDFEFFAACGSMINSMAFSADTMFLAGSHFGGQSGTVYKFNKFVGGVNYAGTFGTSNSAGVVLAHEGLIYVGGSDGTILEMDPITGDVLRTFEFFLPVTGIAPTTGLLSCPADYDISGDLNFFDIAQFLNLYIARLPSGDANGDGAYDFFDVQTFIDLYNTGCP